MRALSNLTAGNNKNYTYFSIVGYGFFRTNDLVSFKYCRVAITSMYCAFATDVLKAVSDLFLGDQTKGDQPSKGTGGLIQELGSG